MGDRWTGSEKPGSDWTGRWQKWTWLPRGKAESHPMRASVVDRPPAFRPPERDVASSKTNGVLDSAAGAKTAVRLVAVS